MLKTMSGADTFCLTANEFLENFEIWAEYDSTKRTVNDLKLSDAFVKVPKQLIPAVLAFKTFRSDYEDARRATTEISKVLKKAATITSGPGFDIAKDPWDIELMNTRALKSPRCRNEVVAIMLNEALWWMRMSEAGSYVPIYMEDLRGLVVSLKEIVDAQIAETFGENAGSAQMVDAETGPSHTRVAFEQEPLMDAWSSLDGRTHENTTTGLP